MARSINHPRCVKAWNTSFEDNRTTRETNNSPAPGRPSPTLSAAKKTFTDNRRDSIMEMRLYPRLYKDSIKETGMKSPLIKLTPTCNEIDQTPLWRRDHNAQYKRAERLLWKTNWTHMRRLDHQRQYTVPHGFQLRTILTRLARL